MDMVLGTKHITVTVGFTTLAHTYKKSRRKENENTKRKKRGLVDSVLDHT